ncbi:MAG: OmpH family outer membrane protein [Prevotella sp.]
MKHLLLLIVWMVGIPLAAQTVVPLGNSGTTATTEQASVLKFGYISYEQALRQMPEYANVQNQLQQLKAKYDEETMRVAQEFNEKYEEFLEGQATFPKAIYQKRQLELEELMNRNVTFKQESLRLLKQAEQEAMMPLHERMAQLLRIIAEDRGYAFIINTDGNACPYINPAQGENLLPIVTATLQK